ncbi:hypothetical protein [Ideonella sp.]|jgi:hypothetical protein|uniref:hypothetical protein n=1 Tax=Ideonella sp. TaxID=1929293 RepID=UPI0037BFB7D8
MMNDQEPLGMANHSLLDAAMAVCFLGDLCMEEIQDDTLGRSLTYIVDKPNMFRWARAYSRICGAHTRDLAQLDLTPQAPDDEVSELLQALRDREGGSPDWRHQLQGLMGRVQHAGVRALAEEALHLSHLAR